MTCGHAFSIVLVGLHRTLEEHTPSCAPTPTPAPHRMQEDGMDTGDQGLGIRSGEGGHLEVEVTAGVTALRKGYLHGNSAV